MKLIFGVPSVVFEAAHRLAVKYGHEWAGHVEAAEFAGVDSLEGLEAFVAAHLAAREYSLPGGICAPSVNESGYLAHTTGSGRLSWSLWEYQGELAVWAEVSRPTGAVLELRPDFSVVVEGRFCPRHVAALREFAEVALEGNPALAGVLAQLEALAPQAEAQQKAEARVELWALEADFSPVLPASLSGALAPVFQAELLAGLRFLAFARSAVLERIEKTL